MIKYLVITAAALLNFGKSFSQVYQPQQPVLQKPTMVLKTRKPPKEKSKEGYLVNLQGDTIDCSFIIRGQKYFAETDGKLHEIEASSVTTIFYRSFEEGNVFVFSLLFHRNASVEGNFLKSFTRIMISLL